MAAVQLREARDSDGPLIYDWMREPEAVRMAAFTATDPDDRDAFDAWFARNRARPDVIQRTIEFDGAAVGSIATFDMGDDREIAYWIASSMWGRSIASAAVQQMLSIDSTRPIRGRVAASNARSAQVLIGAGFRQIDEDSGYAAGLGRVEKELIYCLSTIPHS